jgi:hypothetical protein
MGFRKIGCRDVNRIVLAADHVQSQSDITFSVLGRRLATMGL